MHINESDERTNGERAVLAKVILPEDNTPLEEGPLDELRSLAETARLVIVGQIEQHRAQPEGATCFGTGKVAEIRQLAERNDADVIIVDNDLKPHQVKNLEEEIKLKVIDRTELILDIFASHARTHQAKLQVELAQLEYTFPRLKRMWTHLSRYKAGIGMRGPGEKQIETDRRIVQKRIGDLKHELKEIDKRRRAQVDQRADEFCVSLVGYTNAGKSSLMNALSGADVLVADKLFATLDTRTRVAELGEGKSAIFSDTVGFIRNLPHHLVASFRATLEETLGADLLLHVVDVSHPACEAQIAAVQGVLEELEVSGTETLYVFNKIDRLPHPDRLLTLRNRFPHSVAVSAVDGDGLDDLRRVIREIIVALSNDLAITCSAGNGRLLAYLAEHGEIRSQEYTDSEVSLVVTLPDRYRADVQRMGGVISKPS